MRVSVIVPTYRDWERLSYCLEALKKQVYPQELVEVIVVNNCPGDACPYLSSLGSNVTILEEAGAGSYNARNRGIEHASGEILAFTDSDCIPDIYWLENAIDIFLKDTTIDRIAGNVKLFFKNTKLTLAEAYESVFAFRQRENAKLGRSVTANLITYKKSFQFVGLFDSSLKSGGDTEWSNRASKIGLTIVYAPQVIVLHPARYSIKEIFNKAKRVGGVYINEKSKGVFLDSLEFLYSLKPSIKGITLIFTRGKKLSFITKLQIMSVRYYIRFIWAREKFRMRNGSTPFEDKNF